MTEHKVLAEWKGNLAIDVHIDNHTVRLDNVKEEGGDDSGPSPKRILLSAVAGCTGMDVVTLLNKMHVYFSRLNISVTGKVAEGYPRIYTDIRVTYEVFVNESDREKFEKAVTLSMEKYCSVSLMLKKAANVTWEIRFLSESESSGSK